MEKKSHWTLFSFLTFPLQRSWFLQQLNLKCGFNNAWNHLQSSRKMNRFLSSPPSLQQKHDKTNLLCTCDPWPLSPFSHHHSGQRITHVISKQELLRWSVLGWKPLPVWGSSSCRPPWAVLALLNFISLSGQRACSRDHMSYSQELIVKEVLNFKKKRHHWLKSCLPVAFSYFS